MAGRRIRAVLRFGREGGARHAGCGRRRRDQRPAQNRQCRAGHVGGLQYRRAAVRHELLRRHAFHSQNRFHQAGPVRRRCGLEARQDVDLCAAATPHGTDHRNGQPGQAGSGPNR